MIAVLEDLALAEDENDVSVLDGGEAVGDDHHGAAVGSALEGSLDETLALRVKAASGLVEEQDARVAHECAGDSYALFLSTRQRHALAADLGVVAIWQRRDKVVDAGVAAHGVQALLRHRPRLNAEQNVFT